MTRLVAVFFLCLFVSPANAFQITCEDVLAYVAQHGKLKALAFAIESGASIAQINKARRCLQNAKTK